MGRGTSREEAGHSGPLLRAARELSPLDEFVNLSLGSRIVDTGS